MKTYHLPLLCTLLLLSACAATGPTGEPRHRHDHDHGHHHDHSTPGHGQEPGEHERASGETPGFQVTEKGLFRVELTPDGGRFQTGLNAAHVVVEDATGAPVTGAAIDVQPWMPLHGHGIDATPTVEEHEAGVYRVTNIDLPMPGVWEIRTAIRKGTKEDTAVFGYFQTDPPSTSSAD